jgi:GNAT superfamily N-acetyltransferase
MDELTLAALDRNYLDANRLFMACSDTGEYVERHDAAIVCCGLPAEDLNWGFLKAPRATPEETANAVTDYFRGRRLRFQVTGRTGAEDGWKGALEAAGWQAAKRVPGMARATPDAIPRPPAGLEIEEVRTPELLGAYRETAFVGFGYPKGAAHIFLNQRMLGLPGLRLYAGRVDGRVVATSMLWVTGEVGGIYWVATLAEQRGRGYGEALTWAAAAGAREHACRTLSLQASEMGRPVYARMGFEHVLDYACYRPADA